MDLLDKYGGTLTAEDYFTPEDIVIDNATPSSAVVVSATGQMLTGILALIISLAAGFIG